MECGLDYSKAEGLFSKSAGTAGPILENFKGSFAKRLTESVRVDFHRRNTNRQSRLDQEGKQKRMTSQRHCAWQCSMNDGVTP